MRTLKALTINLKNPNKLGLSKIKNIYSSKYMTERVKRQTIEEMFTFFWGGG